MDYKMISLGMDSRIKKKKLINKNGFKQEKSRGAALNIASASLAPIWPFLKSKLALRAGTDLATLILLSKTTQQS